MSRNAFPRIDYEQRQHDDYLEKRRLEREDAERESRASLDRSMEELKTTALRVKAERDEALSLLRLSLELSEIGRKGPWKTEVRSFLQRLGEAP